MHYIANIQIKWIVSIFFFNHIINLRFDWFLVLDRGDEGMVEEVLGTWPSFSTFLAAFAVETFKVAGELLGNFRGFIGGDEVHCLEGGDAEVWWLFLAHFNQYNASGPDIDFFIVVLLSNELGCHPGRCPHRRVPHFPLFGELHGEAKVGNFDIPIFRHEDVIAFEVPVDLFFRMEHG